MIAIMSSQHQKDASTATGPQIAQNRLSRVAASAGRWVLRMERGRQSAFKKRRGHFRLDQAGTSSTRRPKKAQQSVSLLATTAKAIVPGNLANWEGGKARLVRVR